MTDPAGPREPGIGAPAQIKGNTFIARIRYVEGHGGRAALERVLGRLPEDDRAALRGLILPVAWYPLDLAVRLDEAIAAELSPDDRTRVFRDMGRASAETNLRTVHRHLMREGDPHYLLERAPDILRLYYDAGRRTYEKTGAKEAVLRTYDVPGASVVDCATNLGWHERAIELCGGRNVRATEPVCRARGGPCCEYRFVWD